jgi:hypothetical protein
MKEDKVLNCADKAEPIDVLKELTAAPAPAPIKEDNALLFCVITEDSVLKKPVPPARLNAVNVEKTTVEKLLIEVCKLPISVRVVA